MVVAAMMAAVSINAQDEWKNEISIAYGAGSNTDLIGSIYKGVFTGKQLNYWGPASLEYFYRPSEKLGIGVIGVIGGCKWDEGKGDPKSTFYSVLPAIKYNWRVREHVSMYSKLGVGLTFGSDSGDVDKSKSSSTTFNFQASFFGIEFGSAFRGFAELGFGEQGVILAGLRYKF